ncbi:MAG: two-component regulator propeller domain-containing protein [Bacteroidia bacterium]
MTRTKSILFFFFLFCIFLNNAFAQLYNFKNFGTKNGLVGSTVNCIFQDSRGFIWFGIQNGVSCFDGNSFKSYTKNDGLIGNEITSFNEDKLGNLWIGTSEGISKFDGLKFTNFTKNDGLNSNYIRFIFIDSKNNLWIAANQGGVVKFENNHFERINGNNRIDSNDVYTISEDKEGNYWFGLSDRVAKYDGENLIQINPLSDSKGKIIFSSFRDSKNDIWFGGSDGFGIVKYNGKTFEAIKLPHGLENDFIGGIIEDKNHNMWFATEHGVLIYDNKNFLLLNEENGLTSKLVTSLCTDYENNIWVGTNSGGVDMLNNVAFSSFTKNQGLSNNKIGAILKTIDNQLLIGTQGFGLNILKNDNSFSSVFSLGKLEKSNVLCLAQNKIGELWVGTEDEGVFILEKKESGYTIKKNIKSWENTSITSITKIVFDNSGNAWLGSFGNGLFLIDANYNVRSFETINKEKIDKLLTLFIDSKQNLWIGTFDAGVIKYDGTSFISYKESDGIANKAVWSIAEDDNNNMFFGTGEGGLSCFDGKHFKTLSTDNNLCSNYIEALIWDNIDNCLWAGTDKGVDKIKLDENFAIKSLRHYGENEGFKGIEVNNNALYMDNKGLIWFGTINGLCCYNRKFDFQNTAPPKLLLTDVLLAYKKVDWKKYTDSVDARNNLPKNLVLSYKDNHLTIQFKALTTDKVMYTYILEGQDVAWSPLSASNEANFSNIAPGKTYTFKVKAVNSNGIWDTNQVSFTFTIKSPWWQTWWFYTISFIFIVVLIYLYVNYRTSKIEKEKALLENIVSERTKELSESNKNITDSITYAKRIQSAILPSEKLIKKHLPNSFVFYKPKDIVAGDFYWLEAVDDLVMFAACDCTGHGVPGAMVSVICNNALHQVVNELGLRKPNEILAKTAELVIENFAKSEEEINDGMDVSFCCYNSKTKVLTWAGANNPLWLIKNGEFMEVKATKLPIARSDIPHEFNMHEFLLQAGDKIYIFSDGYHDQFGVPPTSGNNYKTDNHGKKLTKKRFRELLISIQDLSMQEQKDTLEKFITEYRRDIEQTDDILVIGVLV